VIYYMALHHMRHSTKSGKPIGMPHISEAHLESTSRVGYSVLFAMCCAVCYVPCRSAI
jgi:hypothetical protein